MEVHNKDNCKTYEYKSRDEFGNERWLCKICGCDVNNAQGTYRTIYNVK